MSPFEAAQQRPRFLPGNITLREGRHRPGDRDALALGTSHQCCRGVYAGHLDALRARDIHLPFAPGVPQGQTLRLLSMLSRSLGLARWRRPCRRCGLRLRRGPPPAPEVDQASATRFDSRIGGQDRLSTGRTRPALCDGAPDSLSRPPNAAPSCVPVPTRRSTGCGRGTCPGQASHHRAQTESVSVACERRRRPGRRGTASRSTQAAEQLRDIVIAFAIRIDFMRAPPHAVGRDI